MLIHYRGLRGRRLAKSELRFSKNVQHPSYGDDQKDIGLQEDD